MVWMCTITTKTPRRFFDNNPNLKTMLESGEAFVFDKASQEILKGTSVSQPRMPDEATYGISVLINCAGKDSRKINPIDYFCGA